MNALEKYTFYLNYDDDDETEGHLVDFSIASNWHHELI